jgi:hypothetical protein
MNETTQGAYNPYESYLLMFPPSLPPPPPSRRKWSKRIMIGLALLLLSAGLGAALLYTGNVSHPSAADHSQVKSVLPPYTATDILHAFQKAGIPTSYVSYNEDIWSFTGNRYHTSVDATSSVWFYEDAPGAIGVWVYSDVAQARQAYNDVARDEMDPQNGVIPDSGKLAEYTHGRCLLLGAGEGRERQVVREQCS